MKRHIIYISGILAVLLSFTACEDFLNQQPRLSQTNELSLATFSGLQSATLGSYTPLYNTNWYGRDLVITSDLRGGNAMISPISSGRFVTEYLWNNNPGATSTLWATAYELIARANNVINKIEGGFEEAGVEQSELNRLDAECKFLRALAYHDLARVFCQPYTKMNGRDNLGVPVVLVTEIGTPARNTLGEVYDQIVNDLLDAIEGLPEVSPNGGTDPAGWATSYAAKALLSRVYLYMGDWQNAADYATEVIDEFPGALYEPAEYATWTNGGSWGTDNGSEVIFEVYGAEGNSTHGNWEVISYIMSPLGYGDIGASYDVYDLMEDGDVRKGMFVNSVKWPTNIWSTKYPGKAPDGNLREDNIPVLRLSEMYLNRAEAIENGATVSGITALDDINTIRNIRNATPYTDVDLPLIYKERRIELCFEGQESFDLARTGRSLERTDYNGAVNRNIAFPDYRWAMAIPQSEMDANPNMEQNPGYSE